jgi:hypothetical protein
MSWHKNKMPQKKEQQSSILQGNQKYAFGVF